MSHPVIIPLLNPNEPEAALAAIHVAEGQYVGVSDLLCTLETTKSAADLHAEIAGYVIGLPFAPGQTVRAGDVFCYLAETPDWQPPASSLPSDTQSAIYNPHSALPSGLRITQPALALAQSAQFDLAKLPIGPMITEAVVRDLIQARQDVLSAEKADLFRSPVQPFDSTAILIYGGGGHGKSLIDLLRSLGTYRLVGVVDDGIAAGETVMGLPVLGGKEVLPALFAQGVRLAVNAVGGIGNIAIRVKVFRLIGEAGFACPAVVHPTAFIEPSAVLSPGVQVFPHAYVGSETRIGFGAIVNTGAIVSHDCTLGSYANVSPGAMLAGGVQVGDGALVGMGVTVNLNVQVGTGARVGNGSTVKSDIPSNGVVRAGTVWPG